MRTTISTLCICFGLTIAIASLADDQEKKRVAVIEFREDTRSSLVQWKPSDFEKRMHKAVEKTKKFSLVDRKELEKIQNTKKYYGRMSPEQEAQVKDLGAEYIVYASIKNAKGNVYSGGSTAGVVIGLTVVNLANSKASDEILVTGQSLGEGRGGELDFADREFKRRDEIERVLEDAGRVAIRKSADKLAEWD